MKQLILMMGFFALAQLNVQAQKYFTRSGKVSFTSDAPLEKIEAYNNSATSVIDLSSGQMEFAILIKAFQFKKALMQEHFNENYLESDQFPKAIFKGKINDFDPGIIEKDGEYPVGVSGQMTIHGVTKEVTTNGTITVKNGQVSATSTFDLKVPDYEIQIPGLMSEKIAETVSISVDMGYEEFKSK